MKRPNKLESMSLGKPLKHKSSALGKARSLPYSGAPERYFTRVGSGLTHEHWTRLERPVKDKHSSLFQTFVNYVRKKFYNICLQVNLQTSNAENSLGLTGSTWSFGGSSSDLKPNASKSADGWNASGGGASNLTPMGQDLWGKSGTGRTPPGVNNIKPFIRRH
jgi:hypothetical protein